MTRANVTLPVGRRELTIAEASAHLGIAEVEIRRRIESGEIPARDICEGAGFWRIPFASLEAAQKPAREFFNEETTPAHHPAIKPASNWLLCAAATSPAIEAEPKSCADSIQA